MSEQDDDLFAGLEGLGRPSTYVDAPEVRKPVLFGGCPKCLNEKVGLVIQAAHLVWKDHYVQTWGGASRQCVSGAQRLCDLPARDVVSQTGLSTPKCICERTP